VRKIRPDARVYFANLPAGASRPILLLILFGNFSRESRRLHHGGRAIFSWKPRPTDLVGNFHPERIRSYLRGNISECRKAGCNFEVILKDTHTCESQPGRFDDWSRIAREEIDRA